MQEAICTFSFSPHFDLRKAVSELVTRLRPFLYWGQHRTIASARFGGSFPPILRFEKLEIHTVFLRFSNRDLTKKLSSNLLAELFRGIRQRSSASCTGSSSSSAGLPVQLPCGSVKLGPSSMISRTASGSCFLRFFIRSPPFAHYSVQKGGDYSSFSVVIAGLLHELQLFAQRKLRRIAAQSLCERGVVRVLCGNVDLVLCAEQIV